MNTARTVSDFTEKVGVPLTVALLGLAATLGAAALAYAFARMSEAATRRREGCAAATKELLAWAEYPYRIRRRTSDDPAELTRLADIGHDLQTALRYRQTWLRSENTWLASIFHQVREAIGDAIGPSCNDAWTRAPVATAAEMILGDWGPQDLDDHLARFERAARFRFGWRRLVGFTRWHPGA